MSVLVEAFRHDEATSVDMSSDADVARAAALLLFNSLSRSATTTPDCVHRKPGLCQLGITILVSVSFQSMYFIIDERSVVPI